MFRKAIATSAASALLLSSCVSTQSGSQVQIGPGVASTYLEQTTGSSQAYQKPRLDIVVPVFDPGLPEDPDDYEENFIWPELRRAEANRFALMLKQELEATGKFGAVRVMPDASATGDLYVLGTITQSNGAEVGIDVQVVDISGREWLDESYEHEVSKAFHKSLRNEGQDAYRPVFTTAANDIAELLKDRENTQLAALKDISELRFGASFVEADFLQHLEVDGSRYNLVSLPSANDPMLKRVESLRVRDQLFIDNFQGNYEDFSARMNESYLLWQEQALIETKAREEAEAEATAELIGGVALVGLAVLAAVAGAGSPTSSGQTAGAAGAVIGGIAGASLISESFQTSEEAKVHRDALNELGDSLDMELAPRVIEFEKETVRLTGSAAEQYAQWRAFLQEIAAAEATPAKQL